MHSSLRKEQKLELLYLPKKSQGFSFKLVFRFVGQNDLNFRVGIPAPEPDQIRLTSRTWNSADHQNATINIGKFNLASLWGKFEILSKLKFILFMTVLLPSKEIISFDFLIISFLAVFIIAFSLWISNFQQCGILLKKYRKGVIIFFYFINCFF